MNMHTYVLHHVNSSHNAMYSSQIFCEGKIEIKHKI